MAHGRAPRGQPLRQRMAVPHGRWKTTTFVAGLTRRGMIAPFVIGGPLNRAAFETCIARVPGARAGPGPAARRRGHGQPLQPQGPEGGEAVDEQLIQEVRLNIDNRAAPGVVGGVDTHKDLHVAAVVDEHDRVLASQSFATTRQGYRQMIAWMRSFGELQRIGIESTGSYGAGLLRFAQQAGIEILEVTSPDRHDRRRRGKNDDLDAQNAAHAAFAGIRTVTPRSRDGMVESLRVLTACRKTAVAARRVALQMIQNTIVCAPDALRDLLRAMTRMQLIRTLAAWRPDLTAYRDIEAAYKISLKSLARRYLELHDEIADLDVMIGAIVDDLAPDLVVRNSIGHNSAAQLLLTAGDNPDRLRSEASFAALCGVNPVPASSGKTIRHRLNRGGDRHANSALHIIAIGRLRTDQRTTDYVAKRVAEGHSKLEAIRALKRYIAREVFAVITRRQKQINTGGIAT